jgi:hypothetical protein
MGMRAEPRMDADGRGWGEEEVITENLARPMPATKLLIADVRLMIWNICRLRRVWGCGASEKCTRAAKILAVCGTKVTKEGSRRPHQSPLIHSATSRGGLGTGL